MKVLVPSQSEPVQNSFAARKYNHDQFMKKQFAKLLLKLLLCLVVLALALAGVALSADWWRGTSASRRVLEIKVGDTKMEVLKKLGRPIAEFENNTMLLNRNNRETWIYGRKFTLANAFSCTPPFFWPIRLRFGPFSGDAVIEFENSGLVTNIIPKWPPSRVSVTNFFGIVCAK